VEVRSSEGLGISPVRPVGGVDALRAIEVRKAQREEDEAGDEADLYLEELPIARILCRGGLNRGGDYVDCPRRSNFDPPCRLNSDPGVEAGFA
jgi:hypothetical protein